MEGTTDLMDMYEQREVMGEGVYGKVTKCLNKETGQVVAVKEVKIAKNTNNVIQRELKMLKAISALDPDDNNIVRFNKYFKSRAGHHYMEFEMLDQSVEGLMKTRTTPFYLHEIRPMAKQLLVALEGLQEVGVMHTDIKPDNIMLVDHEDEPFRIKLIDFGVSKLVSEVKTGMRMQPLIYRAPEVTLGLPLSEAVDMWSLGCCLLEWYLRIVPFNVCSSYDIMKQTTHLLGVPDGDLITRAKRGADFFVQEDSHWRLKTPSEYEKTKGVSPQMEQSVLEAAINLEDAVLNYHPKQSELEFEDRKAFLDLLQKMFIVNPEDRITPAEALRHPFITMSHMKNTFVYIVDSAHSMNFMPPRDSGQDPGNQTDSDRSSSSISLLSLVRTWAREGRSTSTPTFSSNPSDRSFHEPEDYALYTDKSKNTEKSKTSEQKDSGTESERSNSVMWQASKINKRRSATTSTEEGFGAGSPSSSTEEGFEVRSPSSSTEEGFEVRSPSSSREEGFGALSSSSSTEEGFEARSPSSFTEEGFEVRRPSTSTEEVFGAQSPFSSTEEGFGAGSPFSSIEEGFKVRSPSTSTEEVLGARSPSSSTEEGSEVRSPSSATEVSFEVRSPSSATEEGSEVRSPSSATEEGFGAQIPSSSTEEGFGAESPSSSTEEGFDVRNPSSSTKEGFGAGSPSSDTEEGFGAGSPSSATKEGFEVRRPSSSTEEGFGARSRPSSSTEVDLGAASPSKFTEESFAARRPSTSTKEGSGVGMTVPFQHTDKLTDTETSNIPHVDEVIQLQPSCSDSRHLASLGLDNCEDKNLRCGRLRRSFNRVLGLIFSPFSKCFGF